MAKSAYLKSYDDKYEFEIGIDESGRGCMAGRVYVGAVVLKKDADLDYSKIKDSKRFSSKKKIREIAEFIKMNALYWDVGYAEPAVIDSINIREAVLSTMNQCAHRILRKMNKEEGDRTILLVDGNDFRPYIDCYNERTMDCREIPHVTLEGGDARFYSIASASILAKVARDDYVLDLCSQHPELMERYKWQTNMGYGTKEHMEGIQKYGITQWHRKSFGLCRNSHVDVL